MFFIVLGQFILVHKAEGDTAAITSRTGRKLDREQIVTLVTRVGANKLHSCEILSPRP